MPLKNLINLYKLNSRGNVLLGAMVAVGVVAAVSGFIFSQSQSVHDLSRVPRIKSTMLQADYRVRRLLMSPNTYASCGSGCYQIQNSAMSLFTATPGCTSSANVKSSSAPANSGAPTNPCDVQVSAPTVALNAADSMYHAKATISYSGGANGVSVQPVSIDMVIPQDVLESTASICPSSTPLLVGFYSTGLPKCQPLPPQSTNNPSCPGSYIQSVNSQTLAVTCAPLAPDITCGNGTVISSYSWGGGSVQSSPPSCQPQADPFKYYNFTPNLVPTNKSAGICPAGQTLSYKLISCSGGDTDPGGADHGYCITSDWNQNCLDLGPGQTSNCTFGSANNNPKRCSYTCNCASGSTPPAVSAPVCGVPPVAQSTWSLLQTDNESQSCNSLVNSNQLWGSMAGCNGTPNVGSSCDPSSSNLTAFRCKTLNSSSPGACTIKIYSCPSQAPTTNLCSSGTASSVSSAGVSYNWTCANSDGTSVPCSQIVSGGAPVTPAFTCPTPTGNIVLMETVQQYYLQLL